MKTHQQTSTTEPAVQGRGGGRETTAGHRNDSEQTEPVRLPGWIVPREEKSLKCTGTSTG